MIMDVDVIAMLDGGASSDIPGLNGKGNLSDSSANRPPTCAEFYNKKHMPIIIAGGQVYSLTGDETEICRRILINLGADERNILPGKKRLNTERMP